MPDSSSLLAREWVSIRDPEDEHRLYTFDVSFLLSGYRCIYGAGCPGITDEDRPRRLAAWADAPGARICHPREEHLLPLHVCYGAASAARMTASAIFDEPVKGYQTVGYRWAN